MDAPGKYSARKRVVVFEALAFVLVVFFIWFDEVIDIPHLLLGAEKTPVNWQESLFESVMIGALGGVMIRHTQKTFQRLKYLEGMLPICASCKKIRDKDNRWHQIESYIHEKSEVEFSHGICPECAAKLYPEYPIHKKGTGK